MMISCPSLSKLKTKPVIYENVVLASDPGTLEQLKELSSNRKAVQDFANENRIGTEAISREMSGGLTSRCEQGIQKLENYIPLLGNLVHQMNADSNRHLIIRRISDIRIRWSSVLTSTSVFQLQGPKFYQINNIYFELGMTLFMYGALLCEHALNILSSDLVKSASLFRQAAGVYCYSANEVLKNLICTQEKPLEAIPNMSSVMSLVCLAEAQAVTARKAEQNGNSEGTLVKLHLGVRDFLAEAIQTLQVASKEVKNVSPRFLGYLLACQALHESISYKYFAERLKREGQMGMAIAVLRWALQSAKQNTPREETWRSQLNQMTEKLESLLRKYEHENEFVWHEKVPPTALTLPLPLPQAVKMVHPIPYEIPACERKLAFKF